MSIAKLTSPFSSNMSLAGILADIIHFSPKLSSMLMMSYLAIRNLVTWFFSFTW